MRVFCEAVEWVLFERANDRSWVDWLRLSNKYARPHLHRCHGRVLRPERVLCDGMRITLKSMETIIVAVIAVALFGYLLVAMLCPEKF
jgi:K+-transporting ATPase KdpF subunit